MTFEENACVNIINFFDNSVVDVVNKKAEKEVKVFPARDTSINVVMRSKAKEVINIGFHFH